MKAEKFNIEGIMVFTPDVYSDQRGYFFESFNALHFEELSGLNVSFVQDNESFSKFGVLRGLHYQLPPYEQGKLIRVIQGKVLDVAVDIREGSTTFGQYLKVELSGENKKQVFIPSGFAHGFVTLSETAIFSYKCTNFYHKGSESGIRYDDHKLNIDWEIEKNQIIVSEKDLLLPDFGNHRKFYCK
jgi:dTDP-4-dehydrorhamnose 3,5-epimerase